MVVPTAGFKLGGRRRPYAEAASQLGVVSAQSLISRGFVDAGHCRGMVAICSNNALEYASAFGRRRTAKPLRVLSAAQRER